MTTDIIKIDIKELNKKDAWIREREALLGTSVHIKKVTNDDELEKAGELQTKISKHIKAIGKDRLEITRKIDAAKKEIMGAEKKLVKELEAELNRLKKLNSDYATELARKAEEERKRQEELMQAEAAKKAEEELSKSEEAKSLFGDDVEFVEETPMPEFIPEDPKKPSTTSNKFVTRWHFQIVNSAEIPREFLVPDEKKIRAYVNMMKDQAKIPGVKIWSKVDVQSK